MDSMVRRLLPFVVALTVGAAPVALEACQSVCASSMAHAAAPHSAMSHARHGGGHLCHDGTAANGPQLSQAPHTCGHDRDDQSPAPNVVVAKSASIAAPLALVPVSSISIAGSVATLTFWSTPPAQRALPTALRSAIPLRI